MLNVHILTQNNVDTLERCLDSIEDNLPHGFCNIVVGDAASTDGTRDICTRRGIRIVDVDPSKNVSSARNKLLTGSWQFYLEPWEVLASGHDYIYHTVVSGDRHLRFNVVQGDVLDKQVRLWKGAQFIGPVFERVSLEGGDVVGVIAAGNPTTNARNKTIVDRWCESSPANPDAYYFRAILALSDRRFKDFLRDSEYFSFLNRGKAATKQMTMLWYYEGCIECFRNHRPDKAIQRCLSCLTVMPTMAEFWCLLGDVHYHTLQMFDKALEFYENALILGSRRQAGDDWLMEIIKYKEYPTKMVDSCRQIIAASTELGVPSY